MLKLPRLFGRREEEGKEKRISSFPPEPATGETAEVYALMKQQLDKSARTLKRAEKKADELKETTEASSLRPPEANHAT